MQFNFEEMKVVPADKWEQVPQDFRGLYQQSEDGYTLRVDDDGVKSAISAISGLNKALVAARAEAKAAKGQKIDLSPLSDFGASPDEIAEAFREQLSQASKGKSEDLERQVSKIKEDLGQAHAQEIQKLSAARDALKSQLYHHLVVAEATKVLAEAGALDPDLVMPMLERQVAVSEDNGKFVVFVKDAAGDPRYSGVTGNPMSIKELVAEMKANEKFGPLFKSEQKPGGGALPQPGRMQRQDQGEKSATQKIADGLQAGLATKAGRR